MSRPLWVDPDRQEYPPLQGDLEVDVAVIGAGFSGLGAAWALRKAGVSAVVVEARTVASGASGRNAGFLLDGPAMSYSAAVERVGHDQTMEVWRLTHENHASIRDVIEECGIECGYLRRGSMTLTNSEQEWQEVLADAGRLATAGIAVCLVERPQLPPPFPRDYFGGVYHAGTGELNPGAFLRGLARSLPANVRLLERTRVLKVSAGHKWSLEAAEGRIRAQAVILATNAYTSALVPEAPIEPIRGQVLATDPLPRVVVPFPMHANYGYQYWRQTAEGQLVVGGWRNVAPENEVGTDEALNEQIQGWLERFAVDLVGARREGIQHRWAGIMGFTPDHMPLVGAIAACPGLFVAAGYMGHGVAMAFRCGALCAELALGGRAGIPTCFDPSRFSQV